MGVGKECRTHYYLLGLKCLLVVMPGVVTYMQGVVILWKKLGGIKTIIKKAGQLALSHMQAVQQVPMYVS